MSNLQCLNTKEECVVHTTLLTRSMEPQKREAGYAIEYRAFVQ